MWFVHEDRKGILLHVPTVVPYDKDATSDVRRKEENRSITHRLDTKEAHKLLRQEYDQLRNVKETLETRYELRTLSSIGPVIDS